MDYTENSDSWRSLIGVHRCPVYAQKDNNAVKRGSHKLRTVQCELGQSDVRSTTVLYRGYRRRTYYTTRYKNIMWSEKADCNQLNLAHEPEPERLCRKGCLFRDGHSP